MDKLQEIFDMQRKLMEHFAIVEAINHDFPLRIPYNLAEFDAQQSVRQLAWFMVEEISEAITEPESFEEVADVLHFLVEIAIVSNLNPRQIVIYEDDNGLERLFEIAGYASRVPLDQAAFDLYQSLAIAIHELKWKPWKQNPAPTNDGLFRVRIAQIFYRFIQFAISAGMTTNTLHQYYMAKAKINLQRIHNGV